MSRILLVDDSPHAQRMGERILSDEGYEVVTVSNADSALIRLDDVDPDVVLADAVMPGRTGYEVCQFVKMSPRHRHVRVILTVGVLEPLDEARVSRVEADGTLKKPFEATALLSMVKPLAEAAAAIRAGGAGPVEGTPTPAKAAPAPFVAVVDAEQVRAAVTVALDASMEAIVDEIARRVMGALQARRPEGERPAVLPGETAPPRAAALEEPRAAAPGPAAPYMESVRRVTPLRLRSGSLMGLDVGRPVEDLLPAAWPLLTPEPRGELLREPAPEGAVRREPASEAPEAPTPAAPPAAPDVAKTPPRVSLLRGRPGSILGLDAYTPDTEETPPPDRH